MSKTDSNANTTDSVSSRIRYRLQNAGVRFHANDNIADFIEDDELDLLQQEVAEKMQGCWKAW
jgi:GTP cyclohydrolase I